jgi:hypothetical protein
MAEVPDVFNQPGAAFVLLPAGIKFPPIEKAWQEKPHVFTEANAHSGNVGVLAGNGYIGLDKDDPVAFEGLELPISTLWETRPGRFGLWFRCSNDMAEALAAIGKKPDQAQLKLFKDGKPCGEVKLQRTYQVIPNSWKRLEDGTRADYKLLDSSPPAEISLSKLLADLQALGITFSSKLEANTAKLESMGKEAKKKRVETDEQRTRRYAEAALEDEVHALAASPTGNRNAQLNRSAFSLGQFVTAGVLSEAEVIRELSRAATCAGLEQDEIDRTIKSGLESGKRHPREIPESNDTGPKAEEQAGPTVIDALISILEHEAEASQDRDFARWEWRLYRPRIQRAVKAGSLSLAGEKKAHKFLKNFKDVLPKYGIEYDDLYPLTRKTKSSKEEFSPEIAAKALDVLKNGNPAQYIADSCRAMVLGAEAAFKKLACCISVQNINQSSGLHPKLNGDSSGGKTYTVYTFAHHMPKEAVIKGSMSAKAGFYHDDGNRVLRILDDYEAGNEDLDTVIKQTSSEFHASYQHRTVANHKGETLQIGGEQTWAITSVDSSQEIQVLNRQMPINVDDSLALTIEVNNLTIKRYCDGERQYPVNEKVLVSRCIIQTLRDEGYIDVRIPFGDRIEWLDTSNRRNPSIFMDLVIAHTAMLRYQREKDSEGYYLATEADFLAAKALFTDKDGEELVKRLTKKERETLEFLVIRPEGITQDDLAEHLKVSRQRAAQILYGQKGAGGLQEKLAIKETKISEMLRINDDERRTIHKTIYSLSDYDKFAGFESVVRLKPLSEEPRKPCKHDASKGASIDTASKQDHASNESKKEKEREIEREEDLRPSSPDESKKPLGNEKNTCNTCTISADSDDHTCIVLASPLQDLHREEPTKADASERIRIAARMEWGYNGMVDPAIVAGKLRLSVNEVISWLEANYTRLETTSGVVRYTQQRAGEATT